jgi:hypothetical protein
MNQSDAARELRQQIKAPQWALSVAAIRDKGEAVLVVRIDPRYRLAVSIPQKFGGFPVKVMWRTPIRAQLTEKN